MDAGGTDRDSPLSIASSVAGIMTFLVALAAAALVRVTYLRNSDDEYFRVKASLSWYKTESAWLAELVRAVGPGHGYGYGSGSPMTMMMAAATAVPSFSSPEVQMYSFVMDDLAKLEQRLLELVEETEERANAGIGDPKERWTLVARSWFPTRVAMAWLPVRAKALELVRQRDALTARVQFTQMSMISSRIRDLESRAKFSEAKNDQALHRLEGQIVEQRAEIRQLEDVIFKLANKRSRNSSDVQSMVESMKARRASQSQPQPQTSPIDSTPPQSTLHDPTTSPLKSPGRSRSK